MGKQKAFNSKPLRERFARECVSAGVADSISNAIEKLLAKLDSDSGGAVAATTVLGSFVAGLGPGLAAYGPALLYLVFFLFQTMRDVRRGTKSPADLAAALRALRSELQAIHDRQVPKEEMERLFGQLFDERMGRMESLIQSHRTGAAITDELAAMVKDAFAELDIEESFEHVRVYLSHITEQLDRVEDKVDRVESKTDRVLDQGEALLAKFEAVLRTSAVGQQAQDPTINRDLAEAAALVARDARSGYADAAKAVADLSPSEATDYLVRRRRDLMESRRKLDARLDEEQDQYDRAVASTAFVQGRIAESLEAIQSLLARHPDDLDATNRLGHIHWLKGQFEAASAAYRRVAEAATDHQWRSIGWNNLGLAYRAMGRFNDAMATYNMSLDEAACDKDVIGQAVILNNMGIIHQQRGQLDAAAACYARACELPGLPAYWDGLENLLGSMGNLALEQSRFREAQDLYAAAYNIHQMRGNKRGQAIQLGNMASLRVAMVAAGVCDRSCLLEATRLCSQSLLLYRDIGDPGGQATQTLQMAIVAFMSGNIEEATEHFNDALLLNERHGLVEGEAYTRTNFGSLLAAKGDADAARRMWIQARKSFSELGASHLVAKVQAWLDNLPPPPP